MNRREALIGAVTAALGAKSAAGLTAADDEATDDSETLGDVVVFYYPLGDVRTKAAVERCIKNWLDSIGEYRDHIVLATTPGETMRLPCLPYVQLLSQARVSSPTLRMVEMADGMSAKFQQLLADGQWHYIPVVKEGFKT
jgi:hypothetical protein